MSPRDVVAANIKALMARLPCPPEKRFKMLREASQVPNGTLDRIVRGVVDAGVDKLEPIAAALGVEPWELLVPPERRDAIHHVAAALSAAGQPAPGPVVPMESAQATPATPLRNRSRRSA